MPPDIGKSLLIGAFFTMIMEMIVAVFKFIRYHPFISLGIFLGILFVKWFYGAVGLDVVDVRKYANMTEIEIGRQIEATECRPEGSSTFCEYDFGETKIWYNTKSKPVRMEMKPRMDPDYAMTEEFYSYALHRIGIEEYYAPKSTNIDRIVWKNVDGMNATLETNQYMTPSRWIIEFNSNAGI